MHTLCRGFALKCFQISTLLIQFFLPAFVDAEPGDVRRLSASALSQTELNVTWSPPEPLATSDPLLLRYTLYYSSLDVLNEKSERLMSVIPQLPDGSVEVELSDLSIGTKYTIGVVAISTMIPVALKYPTLNIVVSTYGKGLLLVLASLVSVTK